MPRSHHPAKRHSTLIVKKSPRTPLVDRLTFVAAVVEPLVTVPQAVIIFRRHSAEDISLSTWVGYEILTIIWIWYAIVHKDKMVFIYQGLFLIIQTVIIIGGLLYGAKW